MNLQLSNEQVATLKGVLTDHLSDLRMEIADTEDYDMRQDLKREEAVLVGLLAQLGEHLQTGEDLRRIA